MNRKTLLFLAASALLFSLVTTGCVLRRHLPASSIGIIGGSDGPTAVFVANSLLTELPHIGEGLGRAMRVINTVVGAIVALVYYNKTGK